MAELIYAKIATFTDDPRKLTHDQLIEVLEFARSIGLGDCYNSDTAYIQKNMAKARVADATGSVESSYGLMNRNRDLVDAVAIGEAFVFEAEHGTQQRMSNGGVVVRVGDKLHAVQPGIFETTYTLPDGTPISLRSSEISENTPAQAQAPASGAYIEGPGTGANQDPSSAIQKILPINMLRVSFAEFRLTGHVDTFIEAFREYMVEYLDRPPLSASGIEYYFTHEERVVVELSGATVDELRRLVARARTTGALPPKPTETKVERPGVKGRTK